MSGTGAAPNDPEVMRAWLNGCPAFATFKDGKVVIENAAAPVASPGVILTGHTGMGGHVVTVDPKYLAAHVVPAGAAVPPAPGTVIQGYVGPGAGTAVEQAAPPPRPKVTAIVAANASHMRSIAKQMGVKDRWSEDKRFFLTFVGASLQGHRYDTILVTSEAQITIRWSKAATEWEREALRCRLNVGGTYVEL